MLGSKPPLARMRAQRARWLADEGYSGALIREEESQLAVEKLDAPLCSTSGVWQEDDTFCPE